MININIDNDYCKMKGCIPELNNFVKLEESLDIEINYNNFSFSELCWFENEGVFIRFSRWEGHEDIMTKYNLHTYGEPTYYMTVCNIDTVKNPNKFEQAINKSIRIYQKILKECGF